MPNDHLARFTRFAVALAGRCTECRAKRTNLNAGCITEARSAKRHFTSAFTARYPFNSGEEKSLFESIIGLRIGGAPSVTVFGLHPDALYAGRESTEGNTEHRDVRLRAPGT